MRLVYVAASVLGLAALFLSPGSAQAQGLQFIPVTPCRVADTRNPNGAFGGPEMTAGSTRTFSVTSSACGIPQSAAAFALNVTVVPDGQLGYLTIWPAGQNQPFVSTLNSDGRVKANAAIVPAGQQGGVNVFVTDQTQVIIDIDGYFVPDGTAGALQFFPLAPCRVADTRGPVGSLGGPFIQAGNSRPFPILASNCNIPTNAAAFSLNFTAVPHGPLAFITVWPSDKNQPLASTLNASTGAVTANAAIVPGAAGSGSVSVFAHDDTDLVIDINGYFAAPAPTNGGLDMFNLSPCRVLDTRNNGAPFNGTIPVNVAATNCGAPAAAKAFVLNATVVPPRPLGWLTLWPDGQQQPFVSTLNAPDGAITSNMAIVPTTNGSIDAFGSDPTQLILDISGYFGSNTPPPPPCTGGPCITIDNVSLGNNLQTLVNVVLSPAPTADTPVTVSSSNSSLITVAGRSGEIGSSSVTYTQPAGTTTTALYVQGLAASGSAQISGAATGYGSSPGTATLFPSAFVLSSLNGNALTIGEFGSAQLTVSPYRLDPSGNPAAIQQIRAGQNTTVSVNVADNAVGSVSPASLTFTGGGDTTSTTQFTAGGNPGQTTITVSEPAGFVAPANNLNQVQVNVGQVTLNCTSNVNVAFNLATQAICSISNNGAAPVDEVITLTSTNPGALLLSPKLSTPGAASINLTIRQGTSTTAPFYLIGAANNGTATYNASSALWNTSSTVTLLRSGFALDGGRGIGNGFPASFPGPDSLITITPVSLDGSGNWLAALPLAPGISATVNVGSSNTSVGTIQGSPVTINGGNSTAVVTFHPTGIGVATISASATGYTTPSSGASVGAVVSQARILVTSPAVPVGQNLEVQTSVILSSAPASNLTLTMSVTGSIRLSATGTDAGATTLNLTIPANQQTALFYIYGQASSGTGTITGNASGYSAGTATVTLGPSGFVIIGPFGVAPLFQTPKAAGPQPLSIQPAVLDSSNNFIITEGLAGSKGAVTVAISNQNTNAGSVPSSVSVPVGGTGTATFTPAQSGQQTIITLAQPSGFNAPAQSPISPGGTLTVTVE